MAFLQFAAEILSAQKADFNWKCHEYWNTRDLFLDPKTQKRLFDAISYARRYEASLPTGVAVDSNRGGRAWLGASALYL